MAARLGVRRSCTALALVLLVGACGRSGGGDSTIGSTLVTPGATSTTTTAAGGATSPANHNTPPTSHSATTAPGATNSSGPLANTDAVRTAARGAPGDFAGVLLAAGPASSITLDVLVQPGEAANAGVVTTLRQILAASSGKAVTVRGPTALNSSSTTYTADDVVRLADEQGKAQSGGSAVIHLLYLKGSFTDNSVLGVTVRADTTAIFPDQIAQAASPIVSRQRLEQAVDTHELGHVLGLVDLYLDEHRADAQHPGHSSNPHSVMYWAVESDLVAQVLDGPPPVDYDGADQADLQKIHAGAPRAH